MSTGVKLGEHAVNVNPFRRALIAWGRQHFRRFPWRLARDPYRILIAEVLLHRTQASQVVPVYTKAIERYPDPSALAQASKKELRRVLFSLGLQWRTDLIREMAVEIVDRFGGVVPRGKSDLLSLSGVSEYIAAAVRCFAWNEPEPIIDTNTVRVVGRLFGLEIKDSSRRNRLFRDLTADLLDPESPRAYNYALLDLADKVCTKKRPPECTICPLQKYCIYGTSTFANYGIDLKNRESNG